MEYSPFVTTGANRSADLVIICDHAQKTVPTEVSNGDLGLTRQDMERHIAYDIGAAGVSLHLGALLNAPVVCSNFSRLVIDPNRGEDDPTLVMQLYDGSIIPGNRHVDLEEREKRLNLCYRPYHREVARLIALRNSPSLISIHSFTPQLRGRPPRPWDIGILSNHDRRLSDTLLQLLTKQEQMTIGDNVPYTGYLQGDTLDKHALQQGLLHSLIEIRNDLIETDAAQENWANTLAPLIRSALSNTKDQKDP